MNRDYFLRLFISPENIFGSRVEKNTVGFTLFRGFKKRVIWRYVQNKNGAFLYKNRKELNIILSNIYKQSLKQNKNLDLFYYDFDNSLKEKFFDFKKYFNEVDNIKYITYKNSLNELLNDLTSLQKDIKDNNKGTGFLEPMSRKITLIFVDLESIKEELKNTKNIFLFKRLLNNAYKERLVIFPLLENAVDFPKELYKELQWAAFIGKDNHKYCKEFYKDLEEGMFSLKQVDLGVVYDSSLTRLQIIHPLKFTISEWEQSRLDFLDAEDKAYINMLNNLDKG